jgi:hypothetical protein
MLVLSVLLNIKVYYSLFLNRHVCSAKITLCTLIFDFGVHIKIITNEIAYYKLRNVLAHNIKQQYIDYRQLF